MLQPKKFKFRKQFRGNWRGVRVKGTSLSFGDYGIKTLDRGWLTARQIEAARKAITHETKRQGKVWIRAFPDKPITKKASGAKMGSGKGDIDAYVAVVRPGKILFEVTGVEREVAREALRLAAAKLPFKTKIVERN
ncbi:50S ribosomal protein L16 [Patescibacteria group bacterium]|nr:50S ribosomal protein L16 [Patescibacteria group bacterium]